MVILMNKSAPTVYTQASNTSSLVLRRARKHRVLGQMLQTLDMGASTSTPLSNPAVRIGTPAPIEGGDNAPTVGATKLSIAVIFSTGVFLIKLLCYDC
jgi:hypothetical protein